MPQRSRPTGPDGIPILGWKERGALPELGIRRMRMKLDTGARSSALHVEDLKVVGETEGPAQGQDGPLPVISFRILYGSRDNPRRHKVTVPTIGRKVVRDTGANAERRFVIRTRIVVGPVDTVADVTVTDRTGMNFRMLVGRLTLEGHCLVDPAHGYLHTPRPPKRRSTTSERRA